MLFQEWTTTTNGDDFTIDSLRTLNTYEGTSGAATTALTSGHNSHRKVPNDGSPSFGPYVLFFLFVTLF